MKKIILSLLLCLFMSLCFAQNDNVLTEDLQEILNQKNNDLIDINILLKSQMPTEHLTHLNIKSDSKEVRREIVINELKKFSEQQQESVMAVIEAEAKNGNVTDINAHWLVNSINCKASRDVVYQLASHPDIKVMGLNKEDVVTEGYDEKDAAPTRGTIASHVTHIQAEKVWDLGYTGKGVTVAVLDSGCNLDHVDIKDHLWTGNANGGYNFVNPGQRPMDNKGHGSHCAGIVCGDGTSGVSTGIAPDATLMVLKVNDTGGTEFDVMVDAIEYAVENGADIISISIGWWAPEASRKETFRSLFENALQVNVVVAAAAGNNRESLATYPAPNNINSPADCPPPYLHEDQTLEGGVSAVISVGGVDEENNIIGVSSQGPVTWQNTTYGDYAYNPGMGLIRPDIVAQGASVKSLAHNSNTDHAIKGGTSMAAPAVAGVMALMLEKNPDLTPAELCRIIEETATPLSQTKSNDFGSGCINALAAVQAVSFDVQGAYLNKYNYTRNFNTGTNQNLELTLVNNGAAATSGETTVTLTSNDSNVTVANGSATISNTIAVNGTATCNFTINVSNLSPDNHVAKLTVTTSGGSNNSFEIELNISNELVAPSNITTQVQNLRDVNLSWEATNNATGYKIYRDGAYVGETSTTSYTDENLDYGTLYTYTITSKRGELETEHSREIRVQTADNPEAPSPTNIVATDNNSSVAISWNNSTGSKGSNIYRKDNIAGTETQIASNVSGDSYTDNISLQEGIYQYGVTNLHSEKETIYEEGFENNGTSLPEGWSVYRVGASQNNWGVKASQTTNGATFNQYMGNYAAFSFYAVNNYDIKFYLVTSSFDLSEYQGSDVTLSFYYITPAWGTDVNNLNVLIGSSPTGPWNAIWTSNKTDVTEWTKDEVDITSYIGSTFYIAFENEIGYGFCSAVDNVSIAIDGNKESRIEWSDNIYKNVNVFAQDGVWNNSSNWETNRIPNANDSHIIINANAVIDGTVEVNSLTINEGASLTLNAGAKLIVNGDFVNTDADAFIINDGAQVIQDNEDVAATFNMNIVNPTEWSSNNKTGWQFISSPVKESSIFDFTDVTGDYDLYRYDGNKEMEWINHKDESNVDEEEEPTITIETITAVEDNTENAFIPSNINYDYTISQQIYTVDDLQGKNGKILSYSFQNAKDLTNGDNTRKFKIYMKNTTKTSFSGDSDWVSMQESDLVFDGNVSYKTKGEWVTINFDTPFEYESGKNIILCVYDNTNAWYTSTTNYYGTATIDNRAIRAYRDDSPYNVSSVGVTGKAEKFIGNAKFVIESGNGGGGGQDPEDPEIPETPTAPAAPVVTATATGSTAATLTWEAVEGATSYNVYMLYTGGEYLHGTTTETSYSVSYLASGANNCFDVTAVNEVGESERTNVCVLTYPAVPQNLAAEVIDASTISLTWDAVNNATAYNIYQGSSQIATNITETTFTVEGLEEGVEYCFSVTSLNATGESAKSTEVCATPATDDRCVVEFILKDSANDTWNGNYLVVSYGTVSQQLTMTTNGVASETFTLKIPSGTTVTVQYVKGPAAYTYPTENSWTIQYEGGEEITTGTGTVNGSTDSFVADCGTGGGGGQEPEDPETPTAPAAPVVTAEATGSTAATLTWEAVEGATSYNVYMLYTGGEYLHGTTTETSYSVSYLTSGANNCFDVTAVNEVGESERTNVCVLTYPAVPQNLAATANETTITLTWNAVTGAESYNVYSGTETVATGLTEATFTTEELAAGEYCYTVKAVNASGESAASTEKCATIKEQGGDEPGDVETGNVVTIGEGNNNTMVVPFNMNSLYSISQQLYTEQEIGKTGTIKGVSFKFKQGFPGTRSIDVYIKHTEKELLTDSYSWESMTSEYKVYSGTMDVSGVNDEWAGITFDTPFVYNGGNIVLCVYDYSNIGIGETYFYTDYFGSSEAKTVYYYPFWGGSALDPSNMNGKGYSSQHRNIIQFTFDSSSKSATREVSSVSPSRGAFESAFQQGVGYMASYEKENTAVFKGNLNHEKSYVFPVSYNSEKDLANFHLLGNPFSFNMKWSNVTATNLASGYAVVNETGGYTYRGAADDEIAVGDGFFVKATSENPSISYSEGRTLRNEKSQSIDVVITGNTGSDNVVVNLGKAGEEGFPKLKNFNEEITTIFVYNNDKSYGIYNCEEEVEEVPIYLNNTNGMGKYTISIDAKGDFENITLVDLVSGDETNMLVHDYNFTASQQENTKRFILKFVEKQQITDNSNFVYQSGEELIVNTQGTVQIIDIVGRVVYNNVVLNESERINISGFTTGTYIVRVIGESEVMTQKIVVY